MVTGHKLLVKILGDRALDEIANSRLFRLKQHTLPWHFEIRHLPGKSNHAADATSRNPSPSICVDGGRSDSPTNPDLTECALMAAIRMDSNDLTTLSWSRIAKETALDPPLSCLVNAITEG